MSISIRPTQKKKKKKKKKRVSASFLVSVNLYLTQCLNPFMDVRNKGRVIKN